MAVSQENLICGHGNLNFIWCSCVTNLPLVCFQTLNSVKAISTWWPGLCFASPRMRLLMGNKMSEFFVYKVSKLCL